MHPLQKFCAYANCNVDAYTLKPCQNNCDPAMVEAGVPSCSGHGKLLTAAADQDQELAEKLAVFNDFITEHIEEGCPTSNHAALKKMAADCQKRLLEVKSAAYRNCTSFKRKAEAPSNDSATEATSLIERAASLKGRSKGTPIGMALDQAASDLRSGAQTPAEVYAHLSELPQGAVPKKAMQLLAPHAPKVSNGSVTSANTAGCMHAYLHYCLIGS